MKTLILLVIVSFFFGCQNEEVLINREELVKRHFPKLTELDTLSPFTVGNGNFAFTADITGFQTFSDLYKDAIPLQTQSNWGWHSFPNVNNFKYEDTFNKIPTYGRLVPYASKNNTKAGQYFRANPHRLNLGKIGLKLVDNIIRDIPFNSIKNINQSLDLWKGVIRSSYSFLGKDINVQTCVSPTSDQIAFRMESENLSNLNLGISIAFPYPTGDWGKYSDDWEKITKHKSIVISKSKNSALIKRELDSTSYYFYVQWEGKAQFDKVTEHEFILKIDGDKELNLSCTFSEEQNFNLTSVNNIFEKNIIHWKDYWTSGAAIDLSGSIDKRAKELERRIILSQYLMAVQCSGNLPPQETGLTFNSWHGKFHLEMHWWHAVHFALWGKPELLVNSLGWYNSIIKSAKATAELQGYAGARWPKMVGPNGLSSPSNVGEYLIWQQPHPIYYAELLYRLNNSDSVLEKYKTIIFETADFMASFAHWDAENDRYVLGPPLKPAQEIYPEQETFNSPFELTYWKYGLQKAIEWSNRLGIEPNKKWLDVLENLSELPNNNGFYQNAENALNTFQDPKHRNDHPTLLGAYGFLPNDKIDKTMMKNTLKEVMKSWNWESTWGWDYPMIAMNAARLGKPEIAIDALLLDVRKNTYLNNGHNYQSERLPIYLPGNGGLLTAVAMMAAGWEGAPNVHAPGFPKNGDWTVKFEGLHKFQ